GASGSSCACQIRVGKRSCERSSGVTVGMGAAAEGCAPFPSVNVRLNFPAISRLPVRLQINVRAADHLVRAADQWSARSPRTFKADRGLRICPIMPCGAAVTDNPLGVI